MKIRRENDLIMGGAELGFGLGFPKNHIADGLFGFKTGKRPKFIMYDSARRKFVAGFKNLQSRILRISAATFE